MVKIVERRTDILSSAVTFVLEDGRRLTCDKSMLQDIGLERLFASQGLSLDAEGERRDVIQSGKVVGSLPVHFDPNNIKSRSFMYRPRSGDFEWGEAGWIAHPSLGPSDLNAIPEFRRPEEK
jgi:hypothetical protein